MIALREESSGNYTRTLVSYEFNNSAFEQAKRIFAEYKGRGILLNESFEDDVWKITDDKRNTSLMRFDCSVVISEWIGCSMTEYRNCLKVYIAYNFGNLTAYTLQDMARRLLSITEMDAAEAALVNNYPSHIADFLQILPESSPERDWVIEQLSETKSNERSSGKSQQRVLSDFQSYLQFGDAMSRFWETASPDEKLFYFPLYFWWNLTAILPLRVTEFLLTPRDCLEQRDGKYFITVRRSKLKGGGRKIAYRVVDDYELKTYELSSALATELAAYINMTNNTVKTELDTLLVTKPHYDYRGINTVAWGKKYYTYFNLDICMQWFQNEVLRSYGDKINKIRLGDTRHLAMINLIISGGSPVICRELASHADIRISSHYYSNISNLVESVTLKRLRKSKNGSEAAITGRPKYSLVKPKHIHRVSDGYCDSAEFEVHSISDCLNIIGSNGEVGDCTVCTHYLPDNQGLQLKFYDESSTKAAVDEDSRYLMQIVELVRKGFGYQEDIGAAMLRLQHSSARYSVKIKEKFDNGET